jgi:hypothetical protein
MLGPYEKQQIAVKARDWIILPVESCIYENPL